MVNVEEVGEGSGIHVVTLSNGKVNALCVQLLDELHAAATEMAAANPRAVVVTGGPRVFAAGADITEFAERGGEEPFALRGSDDVARIGGAFLRALNAVAALPCPTIAAVNGFALGGGCELALACDFRVASDRARFGQPEILLGIIPGGGGTQRLARLVGPARAKDLVLSGRMVGAAEAQAMGLVDMVVEGTVVEGTGGDDAVATPGDALAASLDLAAHYAKGPRGSAALAKRAIDEGLDGSLGAGLELEQRLFVESFGTDDATVGVQSFLRNGPGHAEFG